MELFSFVIIGVFGILVFFICREVFCWYWKLNRIVELLEEINQRLPYKSNGTTGNASNNAGVEE